MEESLKSYKHHEFYQKGYYDGYKDALGKAFELFKPQIMNQSIQMVITKDELIKGVCEGKCYLHNTELCKPDGLALFDATTCKNFHTKESMLNQIKIDCKNLTKCWDEYYPFDGCNKNGRGHGRDAENCNPTLDCKKYCKNCE